MRPTKTSGALASAIVDVVEERWREPDDGIWEVRGGRRALHSLQGDGLGRARSRRAGRRGRSGWTGPSIAGARCATRSTPRSARTASTRSADRSRSPTARAKLDASLLLIPLVGFLPARRPAGRAAPSRRSSANCCADGFVLRYRRAAAGARTGCRRARGLSAARSGSLTTTCCWARADARALFERLLALRNDVGLLVRGVRPRRRSGWSAISRRPSRTSAWSTPRSISPTKSAPPASTEPPCPVARDRRRSEAAQVSWHRSSTQKPLRSICMAIPRGSIAAGTRPRSTHWPTRLSKTRSAELSGS